MSKADITVFTPTYNRSKLLERVFDSLVEQTVSNFIWMVVDDGSDDDTKELIKRIRKNADFDIQYIYQENGGKHRAHNTAVKNCRTDYLLILDSDDYLSSDAIEVLQRKILNIEGDDDICGVIGNRFDAVSKKVIGTEMPCNQKIIDGLTLYQKMGFTGDTVRLYKISVLRRFLFPEISGEKFMSENVIFDKIDEQYKMLTMNEKIYFGEYGDDGLTKNIIFYRLKSPIGTSFSYMVAAETAVSFKKRFGAMALYQIWCHKMNIPIKIGDINRKGTFLLSLPLSFVMTMLKYPKSFFQMFNYKEDIYE